MKSAFDALDVEHASGMPSAQSTPCCPRASHAPSRAFPSMCSVPREATQYFFGSASHPFSQMDMFGGEPPKALAMAIGLPLKMGLRQGITKSLLPSSPTMPVLPTAMSPNAKMPKFRSEHPVGRGGPVFGDAQLFVIQCTQASSSSSLQGFQYDTWNSKTENAKSGLSLLLTKVDISLRSFSRTLTSFAWCGSPYSPRKTGGISVLNSVRSLGYLTKNCSLNTEAWTKAFSEWTHLFLTACSQPSVLNV
mmetsp:Transcript_15487/g.46391  ORF Transcript_15487/g.46391 Transcript_15487/m.46391 type:complete len:249 (-) Transcript_15487:792-1538(-)